MLKELIQNTKPEIFLSIQDDWLDSCGDDTPARFVDLTWHWSDAKGNWASLDVLGAIEDAPDGNFDIATLDYSFVDTIPHFGNDGLSDAERKELHELMEETAAGFNPLHDGYIREDI